MDTFSLGGTNLLPRLFAEIQNVPSLRFREALLITVPAAPGIAITGPHADRIGQKVCFDMRRFLLRGLEGVQSEWQWCCTAFNLKKLMTLMAALRAEHCKTAKAER